MNDHHITAIDVALLPPPEVMEQATLLNRALWEKSQTGIQFDDTHIPHITLVQLFVNVVDLPAVYAAIQTASAGIQPIECQVTGIGGVHFSDGLDVSYYQIASDSELQRLHEGITSSVAPFATDGSAAAYVRNPLEEIRPETVRWTQTFLTDHAQEQFDPHITIGVGPTQILEKPFAFTTDRLTVCHLGNFNTCRDILREWHLGS